MCITLIRLDYVEITFKFKIFSYFANDIIMRSDHLF